MDRAITRALKEQREEAELLKTFGYSTFALKIDLLRDLPFYSERLGVSRGGPCFVILLRDSGWRTVTRAEITVDIDRKCAHPNDRRPSHVAPARRCAGPLWGAILQLDSTFLPPECFCPLEFFHTLGNENTKPPRFSTHFLKRDNFPKRKLTNKHPLPLSAPLKKSLMGDEIVKST